MGRTTTGYPMAATSVDVSRSSLWAWSGEDVQQTMLSRGRERGSSPATSPMRLNASSCQRPSTSCCTCICVQESIGISSASILRDSGRSVAVQMAHMMAVHAVSRSMVALPRSSRVLERRTPVSKSSACGGEPELVKCATPSPSNSRARRGPREQDLARAEGQRLLHEMGGDPGHAALAIDLRSRLGERLERISMAEVHADALEETHGLVDDALTLLLRGPFEPGAHDHLHYSSLPVAGPRLTRSTLTFTLPAPTPRGCHLLQARPEPRADEDRDDVRGQIEPDVEGGDDQCDRLDHRHVATPDRIDVQGADAGKSEQVLDDDHAAGEPGQGNRSRLDRGRQSVGQRVTRYHRPLLEALEARHLDVVALHDVY